MKTKWIFEVCAVCTLIISLTGCARGVSDANNGSVKTPPNGNGASRVQNAQDHVLTDYVKTTGRVTPDYLKSRMKANMTMEEASAAFGQNYIPIPRQEAGMTKWRYDFGDVGYQFQNKKPDEPDVDGVARGMVHSQLFLTWDPATSRMINAELYYKASDAHGDHTVNRYTVSEDGQTKEGRV